LRLPILPLLAAALVAASAALGAPGASPSDWTTYGNDLGRSGAALAAPDLKSLKVRWNLQLPGVFSAQPLVVHDRPSQGQATIYAVTSAGTVVGVAPNGFVRWQVELGQLANPCPQLDGWGNTGTPVADPATNSLYLADAFGRLHALDLNSGAEHPGWPVRIYPDFSDELVWGAMTLVHGALYVPTGSYCDLPMEGKIIRVDLADRGVSSWTVVPYDLGGGGGIWGWGGIASSRKSGSLFVVTGNAFEGGSNKGDAFTEAAGYGEQLVQLDRSLQVQTAVHPLPYGKLVDNDLVGSPVVFERPDCGEIVIALAKSGAVYGWKTSDIGQKTLFTVQLAKFDPTNPVVSQPAWDAATNTLVFTASGRVIGLRVGADCRAKIGFSHMFGPHRLVGSPTVSTGIAWQTDAPHAADYLVGIDLETGRQVARLRIGEHVLVAPTIVDGQIILGGFNGMLFGLGPPIAQPALPEKPGRGGIARQVSYFGRFGWRAVEGGVLGTTDRGKSWKPVLKVPVDRVLRASRLMGVVTTPSGPRKCACSPRVLWTGDAGKTWRLSGAIGGAYAGGRTGLYWWKGADVFQVTPWPTQNGPLHAAKVFSSETGRIAAGDFADGVFYGVWGAHRGGRAWDTAPKLVKIADGKPTTIELPETNGAVLVQEIRVTGKTVQVRAYDYGFANADTPTVMWTSQDGGATWALARS